MADFKPTFDKPVDSNRDPLQKFSGVLKEYTAEEVHDEKFNRDYKRIKFDFTDVEVIRSSESYPFPITTKLISWSQAAKTRWAVLAESARKILPDDVVDVDLLVGKRQTWEYAPAVIRVPATDGGGDWIDDERDCWQIISVEGYSTKESGNLMDVLVDLADGKTEKEFNSAAFADSELRRMGGFNMAVEMITNRDFFPAMKDTGKLTLDDEGIWHKA